MASYSWLPPESHLPRRLFGAMLRRIAALPLHGPPSRSVRKHTKKNAPTEAIRYIFARIREARNEIPVKSLQFFAV